MKAFFTVWAILLLFSVPAPAASPDVSNVVITPGGTGGELNFAWQSQAGTVAEARVQIALKSDMTSADFPEGMSLTFTGKSDDFADELVSNKVTVNRLTPSTSYVYRLGIGQIGKWSEVYEFSTRDEEIYSVLLVGDIQIGAKRIAEDTAGWQDTLDKALQKVPDAAFILSAGDQVDNSSSRDEYDGLLLPPQLKSLPFVPTIGNHDNHELFSYHFNIPNESPVLGRTRAGGNYYFVYGNALFMVINSNSRNYNQHEAFIRAAVRKNPQAHWRIVMMHHSIYGADMPRSGLIEARENFGSIFDKYRMDVVLAGHEHIYARSHFMLNNQAVQPLDEFPARATPPMEIPDGAVIKPTGTLYLTVGSASGSKYYMPAREFFDYLAERAAPYVPMFSRINITDTSFEIITYRTDDMTVVDRFVMVKAIEAGGLWRNVVILLAAAVVLGVAAWFIVVIYSRPRVGGGL